MLIIHDRLLRTELPQSYLGHPLQGALLIGPLASRVISRYAKLDFPSVLVDRPGNTYRLHSISVDNVASAFDATSRLIALGHRRIAFVRLVAMGLQDVDPDSRERQSGYLRAMRKSKIAAKHSLIVNVFSYTHPREPGFQALFEARPAFTAAVVVDYVQAQRLIEAARLRGKSVPRDLSVACWVGMHHSPNLGGPRIDFETLGRRAVQLLKEPRKPPRHEILSTEWSDGETISPPG